MPQGIDVGEQNILVTLSKAITTDMIAKLKTGEATAQEIGNMLRHLKANDISYDMMKNEKEVKKTLSLLADIEITKDSDEGLEYLKNG